MKSQRRKPKLIYNGYSYHAEKANGEIAWHCDMNNKQQRDKGESCTSTAVTTGMSPNSNLGYAIDHSHPSTTRKIKAKVVGGNGKSRASEEQTAKTHLMVTAAVCSLYPEVQLNLLTTKSIKRSLSRRKKPNSQRNNPDLAVASDRILTELHIPISLILPFKHFDSGSGENIILIFTTDSNLALLRESMTWCGDGTFKAAPALWSQLYSIHGQ